MADILADRLNNEPFIIGGLTDTELLLTVKVALPTLVPLSVVISWMLGHPMMGVGVGSLLVLISVIVVSKILLRVKRGRPDHYYAHYLMMRNRSNTDSDEPIKYTGDWGIGRDL